jgi:diguanylate cyclase (GGDEF)-like protein
LNEALRIASTQDPLTGLPNRRLMMDRLNGETAKVDRGHKVFSLALIDADHFKQINDRFGHDIGDKALVAIAEALGRSLRPYDLASRWGGEEFLVLLPETTGEQAREVANRLRTATESCTDEQLPDDLEISVSIGVAEHHPSAPWDETVKRADNALYAAKRGGRNRVVVEE